MLTAIAEEESAMAEDIVPFQIAATDEELEDLRSRLRATRWPNQEVVSDWSQGIPLAYTKEVCAYWAEGYDWRAREAHLKHLLHGCDARRLPA